MANLLRLAKYLIPHWPYLLFVVLAMAVTVTFDLSPALLVQRIVDEALANGDITLAAKLSLAFIGIAALKGISNYLQWYVSELVGQRVIYKLRQTIHDHLQVLPPSYFAGMGTGQVMSRLTSDVDAVQQFVSWSGLFLSQMVLMFVMGTSLLAFLNWKLTLFTLIITPFLFQTVFWFDKHVRPAWKNVREMMGKITETLQENVGGIRVIKAFAREVHEIGKFSKRNRAHFDANMERAEIEAKAQPVLDFYSGLTSVAVIGFGSYLVLSGEMTAGTLVACYSLIWVLIWPTRMLGWLVNMAEQAMAAAPRLFELIDAEPAIKNTETPVVLDKVQGHLRFENVSFQFPGDSREALSDINLEIKPGERVAIVGGTGSGKSTLVNMIPRFLDPTEGRITLDGHDLRDLDLKSLRSHIGLVLQDNFLFSASVKDNLALGKEGATDLEIQEAAQLAQAAGFISELPKGYETPVGERGIGLSGGQKQRIALARALLVNPKVLILDEATSSVDTETEYLIQEGLDEVMSGRTSLIIAKRLSTIRGADKIVVMENGRITDTGTHETLLRKPGFYRRLFESQFAEEDVEKALRLELEDEGLTRNGEGQSEVNTIG